MKQNNLQSFWANLLIIFTIKIPQTSQTQKKTNPQIFLDSQVLSVRSCSNHTHRSMDVNVYAWTSRDGWWDTRDPGWQMCGTHLHHTSPSGSLSTLTTHVCDQGECGTDSGKMTSCAQGRNTAKRSACGSTTKDGKSSNRLWGNGPPRPARASFQQASRSEWMIMAQWPARTFEKTINYDAGVGLRSSSKSSSLEMQLIAEPSLSLSSILWSNTEYMAGTQGRWRWISKRAATSWQIVRTL